MSMRTPVVEDPIKAPQIEPAAGPEVRFDAEIPERTSEIKSVGQSVDEVTTGMKEMNESFQKQADFAVQNQYEAKLKAASIDAVGKAKTYVGTDALGAVAPALDQYNKSADEIGKDIKDPRQRDAFEQARQKIANSTNEEVHQHAAENIKGVHQQSIKSNIDETMKSVASHVDNPAFLAKDRQNLKDINDKNADYTGMDAQQRKDSTMGMNQQYYDQLVNANVNKSRPREALKLLDTAKANGEISQDFYDKQHDWLQPHLDLADATEQFSGSKTVKGMQGDPKFFGPGGVPKESAIESHIQALYGATKEDPMGGDYEKADRVFKKVMNLAHENQDKIQRGRDNSLRAYTNEMMTMHDNYVKTGDPKYDLNHAQNRAADFKWDRESLNDMQNRAASFYASPTKETENQARNAEALRVQIHTGRDVSNEELQKHYESGDITPQKLKSLRTENDQYQESGKGGDKQMAYAQARKRFGDYYDNPKEANAEMSKLIDETKGKNAVDIEKSSIDRLDMIKKMPTHPLSFLGTNTETVQHADQKNYQRAWNGLVGKEQTNSILESINSNKTHGEKADLSDLANFASMFPNGMDDLAVGQPANNAIQSLKAHGEPITHAKIQQVLERSSDGIY